MLLLTANESKHLSVSMALDKKPAGPRNSFIIRPPRLLFFLSSRFVSHCGNGRAAIIANFRFGDATCQLPPRVALSPRIRERLSGRRALGFIAHANSAERSIYRIIPIAGSYQRP